MGNDVRILGLPLRRPDTEHAFRMLCRHNRYVQEFGRVRDADEIGSPRARLGRGDRGASSSETGHEIGAVPAERFRRLMAEEIDLRAFELRLERRPRRAASRTQERSHR